MLIICSFSLCALELLSYSILRKSTRAVLRIYEESDSGGVSNIGVKKNFEQKWKHEEFCVSVRTNNLGLREQQDYMGERIDVGFFGDSFTFGFGVEHGERYSDQLRKMFPDKTIVSFSVTTQVAPP